ncbi:hypothetical protein SAMN04488503_1401 [Humidesulfovibrio mexicanus]|uniref:Heavy-metal resistance n=1 Tax=Humidesulfovibrio mexicanus TaxID=147047 RepID=A0A238ZCE5_9BACT|nr:hypothetical protein [Humidesulfovibrio mexicanus]SNR80668.1 hypothetical protein SAMN04488503_1401 [Humidesulfovibrio mexicanus]
MKSWKAWLLVAVIFLTGAMAGAYAMRVYMVRNLPELLEHTRQRLEEHFLDVIDREVGLRPEQKERILPILRESVLKGDRIHASVREQMDAVRKEADERIANELDADQRVKFDEFRVRMEKLARQGPRPGGPPPPGFSPPPGPPPEGDPRGFPATKEMQPHQ